MKRLTLSVVAGLLLLGGTTAVAQDDPQQIVIDPLQHTLNGARVALVKGVFYMGIPIVVPLPPPTLCDLVLKFGARFDAWGENDPPIGLLRLRTYSGGIATSSNGSPLDGKIRPYGVGRAVWDLNGDGERGSEEPIFELIDDFTIRMSNLAILGALLTPGCLDFVFWSGFVIEDPNYIDFCVWSVHEDVVAGSPVRTHVHGPAGFGPTEGHVFRTVGGGKIIPALFNIDLGSVILRSEITLTNTGYKQLQGFLEFFDAATGSFTFPFSFSLLLAPGQSQIIRLPFFDALRLMAIVNSNSSLADLFIGVAFLTYLAQPGTLDEGAPASQSVEELVGGAGLGSPALAGEQVVGVSHTSTGGNTGVLIANPNPEIGNLHLVLLDGANELVSETNLQMQALTSVSMFFFQYFGIEPVGELEDFEGTLRISGDVPTAVITLGTQDGFQQFSLPAGGGQIGAQ